jgi:hypothetical protein
MAQKDYGGARAELALAAAPRGSASLEFASLLMDAVEGKIDPAPVAARLLPMPDGFFDRSAVSPLTDVDAVYWFMAVRRPDDAVARLQRMARDLPNLARASIADPGMDSLRCRPDFQAIATQLGAADSRAARICMTLR